jgi:hypothetical protein
MATTDSSGVIRVVRGEPDAIELAALTAVVLARAAACEGAYGGTAGAGPAPVGWHRGERTGVFLGPRTWRGAGTAAPGA